MDERVINELIKQLTENLEKVESARQQVQNTVQAYDVLKTDIGKYTTELSFITQNVRTMISQLEEMKKRFLGNISTEIIDEIKHSTASLSKSIDDVSVKVTPLKELIYSKSKDVNSYIKQRFDTTDVTLANINTLINDVDVKVASCSRQIAQIATSIQFLSESEQEHYDAIHKKLEEQEKRLNTEFDIVRKQNNIFSIMIIIMLVAIIGILFFKGGI